MTALLFLLPFLVAMGLTIWSEKRYPDHDLDGIDEMIENAPTDQKNYDGPM